MTQLSSTAIRQLHGFRRAGFNDVAIATLISEANKCRADRGGRLVTGSDLDTALEAHDTPASPQTAADVQSARHESETRRNDDEDNAPRRQHPEGY